MARDTTPIAARRLRLTLQSPVSVPDGAGGRIESFVTLATLWAERRWIGGDERWRADRPEQASRHEITLRWRDGVDAGMRFAGQGRVFHILALGDPDGTRRRLVCTCEEITP